MGGCVGERLYTTESETETSCGDYEVYSTTDIDGWIAKNDTHSNSNVSHSEFVGNETSNSSKKGQKELKKKSMTGHVEYESGNRRGINIKSSGSDTRKQNLSTKHQSREEDNIQKNSSVLSSYKVREATHVACVAKVDNADSAKDRTRGLVHWKGSEIMCRFLPNENGGDHCFQCGDLEADLKAHTDWELLDSEDLWAKDQTVFKVRTPRGSAMGYTRGFEFDRLFPPNCTNRKLYNILRKQWFPSLVRGVSVGIIPYGVTGSGKSHTMHGSREDPGIAPLFCQEVFQHLAMNYRGEDFSTRVRVTFLEIYNDKVVDLLQYREELDEYDAIQRLDPGRGLLVNHDQERPFRRSPVPSATDLEVFNEQELLQAFWTGYGRLRRQELIDQGVERTISLSNSIFIITILRKHKATGLTTNAQFQVVDLGGPFFAKELEGLDGRSLDLENLRVIAGLNESLLAFRKVMLWSDSSSNERHKPYRDSKVTQIMEPLLEKGKTAIIVHVSEGSSSATKTIETLRFGFNASQLSKVNIMEDVSIQEPEICEEGDHEPMYYNLKGRTLPRGVSVG